MMAAQSENPRAALTAEGVAEKPRGSSDESSVSAAPAPPQAAQLSRSETEENFRQVLSLQSSAAELIIAASRLPSDARGLAASCAALAERALCVALVLERDPARREGLQYLVSALDEYQRDVVYEIAGV
jgi:hypothetical protein